MSGAAAFLDTLSNEDARSALESCCRSSAWVDAMLNAHPFSSDERLFAAAERAWWSLGKAAWLEAFASHPRIGASAAAARGAAASATSRRSAAWSEREQAGASQADPATAAALARDNLEYERRFGHVFLICATGKSASEMLGELRRRMTNDPETELRVAAGEQAKITRLRLEKLHGP